MRSAARGVKYGGPGGSAFSQTDLVLVRDNRYLHATCRLASDLSLTCARRTEPMPRQFLVNAFVTSTARPLAVLAVLVGLSGCRSLTPNAAPTQARSERGLPSLLGESISQYEPPRSIDVLPVRPSNERNWKPQFAKLPAAEFAGTRVTVRNIRNFEYVTANDFVPRYYDRTFDLRDVESVDYLVVPFETAPLLAHTMLSFGFRGGQQLVTSVEVRLEEGESYSPTLGAMRQFELMYVLADERDAIRLRTEIRKDNVYMYRVNASPEQARDMLVDVLDRVNKLQDEPEFYDTLTNNCTTNIVAHVNRLSPNRVPYDLRVLMPGMSAQLAYDLGLLDQSVPFDELARRANITQLARLYARDPDFSRQIRR